MLACAHVRRYPSLVRLGRSEATHDEVRDLHVDRLAERLQGGCQRV